MNYLIYLLISVMYNSESDFLPCQEAPEEDGRPHRGHADGRGSGQAPEEGEAPATCAGPCDLQGNAEDAAEHDSDHD